MRFEFATAGHIYFGPGTLKEAGKHAKEWGRKALLVTGKNPMRAHYLVDHLEVDRISATIFSVPGEPTVEEVMQGATLARKIGVDFVIGIGGGSVIDAAKAIAALVTNQDPVMDYLEVVGKGLPLELPALPWMAVPTTAGTGAEVTKNAVLTIPEQKLKVSLRSPHLFASAVVVDPELTLDMPAALTAATGMDALCQLIEAFVCIRANPMTDALCVSGIEKAAKALPAAWAQPKDLEARTEMCLAAHWSGMALANAGLGAVHGFASPIGGSFGAPHGAICGVLLAPVMEANLKALRERAPGHASVAKYEQLGRLLTGASQARAEDAVEFVRTLTAKFGLSRLTTLGVSEASIPELVQKAKAASSMKANPIPLTEGELEAILRSAM